ncbi:hypothetical protein KFL_013940010, partial [Klebsormidium nitens]
MAHPDDELSYSASEDEAPPLEPPVPEAPAPEDEELEDAPEEDPAPPA